LVELLGSVPSAFFSKNGNITATISSHVSHGVFCPAFLDSGCKRVRLLHAPMAAMLCPSHITLCG
jgi:hypothetical protein